MKVLIVSNEYPRSDRPYNPVVQRIVAATEKDARVESVAFVPFTNHLSDFRKIRRAARDSDVVHIHFGGMYAFLVRLAVTGIKTKKFITFHGTDIHMGELTTTRSLLRRLKIRLNQKCSFLSLFCFDGCGFVSKELIEYIPAPIKKKTSKKYFIHRLGVDYDLFRIIPKEEARKLLGITSSKRQVLFSDLYGTPLKRRDLAQAIVKELGEDFELLVMSGVKPESVPIYLNASDFLLLTSEVEGSPNIVREALALNVSVFSVNVGDVPEQIKGLNSSAIISRDLNETEMQITAKIQKWAKEDTRKILQDSIDVKSLSSKVVDRYFEKL